MGMMARLVSFRPFPGRRPFEDLRAGRENPLFVVAEAVAVLPIIEQRQVQVGYAVAADETHPQIPTVLAMIGLVVAIQGFQTFPPDHRAGTMRRLIQQRHLIEIVPLHDLEHLPLSIHQKVVGEDEPDVGAPVERAGQEFKGVGWR